MSSEVSALQTTVAGKQDALSFDSTPTSGSGNPVTSGGIYTAISNKMDKVTSVGSSSKPIYINSSGVPTACSYSIGTAASYGVTTSVTSGSSSLVTSGAVYNAINSMRNKIKSIQLYATMSSSYNNAGRVTINLADGVKSANCTIVWHFDRYTWNGTNSYYSAGLNGKGSQYTETKTITASDNTEDYVLQVSSSNTGTGYGGYIGVTVVCGTQVLSAYYANNSTSSNGLSGTVTTNA